MSGSFGFWQQGLFTFGFREMGAAVTLLKMFSLQTLLLPDDTTCVSDSVDEKNPSADEVALWCYKWIGLDGMDLRVG